MMRTLLAAALLAATPAMADEATKEELGRSAMMTPQKVAEALSLVKNNEVLSLGRVYQAEMPLFGARAFAIRATAGLAGGPVGKNQTIWMDDFLATEIGQVGTQFDGLAHIGVHIDDVATFYGGHTGADVFGPTGVKALGIEKVKPFFTRGVLFDIAGLKGQMLEGGTEITVADLEAALERQGVEPPGEGDVALIHTGWGSLWMEDNERFNGSAPGIGMEAGQWFVDRGVVIVGSDTWPVEVVPNPDAEQAFPVHQLFLPQNGIFIHENVATERLAEAGVNEFAYIYAPVPIKGATGSPGAPLALH